MTLAFTNGNNKILKKFEELFNKIENTIKSIANNSDNNDETCIKIKFNSDGDLPFKKTLGLHNMVIVVKSIFHECNKYYLQVFLYEFLYKT